MTYLLAKYALIFLLSLIAGILFGRWMTRRSFVDVSDSYEDLRDAATRSDAANWNTLWCRLDSMSTPNDLDLSGVMDRFNALSYAIGNLPAPSAVNLAPVDERLAAIEVELVRLGRRLEVVPQDDTSPVAAESDGPVTLETASYGDKDQLQRIFGVGPMLEALLNKHGVFYFWQIADWTDHDVEVMNGRLDTFKGRIARDNWVDQAMLLGTEPGSAKQPTEMRISA